MVILKSPEMIQFQGKTGLSNVQTIALFPANFSHLDYNAMQREHEAISGCLVIFAQNCLTFMLNFIVMQL